MGLISAASTWWVGHIGGATIQSQLIDPVNSLPLGFLGESPNLTGPTLATLAQDYVVAPVTFTLTAQRRLRVVVNCRPQMASGTTGRYLIQAAYNSGPAADLSSATKFGFGGCTVLTAAGLNGSETMGSEGTVLLAAGEWTIFAAVQRNSGGTATDTANGVYCGVYDQGAN